MKTQPTQMALGPGIMPVDREAWAREIHLSNFVNSYYHYRDLQYCEAPKRILIVGPGQGLQVMVLKWRGYDVKTLDVDATFKPDYLGSVHNMHMLKDQEFDVVVASHVLEHLPLEYLEGCLAELARVGKFALIYLPVHGRLGFLRFVPGIRTFDFRLTFEIFNYFERPDGRTPKYMCGMHYWEVGLRGFRVRDLIRRFERHFSVVTHYRNRDWLPSYNYVLKSRVGAKETPN